MSSKQITFINKISQIARAEYLSRDKWVLPSVCIAQAALESGWNLNAKTLFGIKGKGVSANTLEYINGHMTRVKATFEAYPTIAAAVDGYYDLITGLPRYSVAVNNPEYHSTVIAICAGGYATDPDYYGKIISIIEKYNLTQYDKRETKTQTAKKEKTIRAVALEVIAGKYGNGSERHRKLEQAGYDYLEVQKAVNTILKERTNDT